jgi:carbonic anhydrase
MPGRVGTIDDLLGNARAYRDGFDKGDLPAPPARRVAIVTCMDARIDPAKLLGLAEGDAHVIRNAGGVVTDDELRSLAISNHLLGTEEVMVIQHTRCGMQTFTDEEFAERMERAAGERPTWSAYAFADLEESVRGAVRTIRESPFVPAPVVRGFVYDVDTGGLREVEAAGP